MSRRNKKKLIKTLISLTFLLIVSVVTTFFNDELLQITGKFKENDKTLETQPTIVNRETEVEGLLKIYFLDVGQADSILLETNGKYMLIDAGNNKDGEKIVNYFNSLGIKQFDYVIGTHAHEDHIGGMDDIINNFSIETFYMPDVVSTSKTFEDVVDALMEKNIAFETPILDSTFSFGNADIKVLSVVKDEKDLNNTSIVLKVSFGNNSFLFTGDASGKVEKEILDKDIEADLLKVGHHGSEYSTTRDFLDKVNPKYAVIQVGKNNIYEHPKDVILNRLKGKNIKVYRTDEDGTIIVKSDGENINISKMETDTNG